MSSICARKLAWFVVFKLLSRTQCISDFEVNSYLEYCLQREKSRGPGYCLIYNFINIFLIWKHIHTKKNKNSKTKSWIEALLLYSKGWTHRIWELEESWWSSGSTPCSVQATQHSGQVAVLGSIQSPPSWVVQAYCLHWCHKCAIRSMQGWQEALMGHTAVPQASCCP